MHRETINWLCDNSFVEIKESQRKIRVHVKGLHGDKDAYSHWKDFNYSWHQNIWELVTRDLKGYEYVLIEWLVNVYEPDRERRMRTYTQSTGVR